MDPLFSWLNSSWIAENDNNTTTSMKSKNEEAPASGKIHHDNDEQDFAMDPRNLSREDSDVGHEYFLRPSPGVADGGGAAYGEEEEAFSFEATTEDGGAANAAADTMFDQDQQQRQPSTAGTPPSPPQFLLNSDEFGALSRSALTPPRVLSSSSLYGEDFVNSVRQLSRSFEQDSAGGGGIQQNAVIFEEQDMNLSPSPRLPVSPNGDGNGSQVTTPPSVLYPQSLSPPPPPSSIGGSPQLPPLMRMNHPQQQQQQQQQHYARSVASQTSSQAQQPPPNNIHMRHNSSGASQASRSSYQKKKNRPPRAPNVQLRFQGGALPAQPPHNRDASTGDASFLSALTDSDYGGDHVVAGGGGGISGMTSVGMPVPPQQPQLATTYAASGGSLQGGVCGGGGASSTAGNTTTSAPPQLQQPILSENLQQRHGPPVWGPDMVGDDDAVRGMNIDIPGSLQQPILGDEEDVDDDDDDDDEDEAEGHDEDKMAVEGADVDKNSMRKIPDDYDFLEGIKDKFSSLTESNLFKPRNSSNFDNPKSSFESKQQQNGIDTLEQLREFETEAETLVLKAVEDQLRASPPDEDFKRALFPNISDKEAQHLEDNSLPSRNSQSSEKNPSGSFSDAALHLHGLRGALQMETYGSSVFRKSKNSDRSTGAGAADILLDNAQTIMAYSSKESMRLRKASSKKKGSKNETQSFVADTPATVPNRENEAEKTDDTEMDDAEKGKNTKLRKTIFDTVAHLPQDLKHTYEYSVQEMRAEWANFEAFVKPQKETIFSYTKNLLLFLIFPSLCVASILFYGFDNPPTGVLARNANVNANNVPASHSWWVLYIGCRVPVVVSVARGMEFYMSNYLGVSSRRFMKFVGTRAGLVLAQSKGWPCVLFFYGCLSFLFETGDGRFARHWLFWQDPIRMCNDHNPSGDVTTRKNVRTFYLLCVIIGVVVTMKRHWMAYHLARRLYSRYNESVRRLVEKLSILTEVASLTLSTRRHTERDASQFILPNYSNDDDTGQNSSSGIPGDTSRPNRRNPMLSPAPNDVFSKKNGSGSVGEPAMAIGESSQADAFSFLDEWEEPVETKKSDYDKASLKDILEFRQAILLLNTKYPFSLAFGLADTRRNCVTSASRVFYKLLDQQGDKTALQFRTLSEIAMNSDGSVNAQRMKLLVKVLRPNKDKQLTLIDFARSVDNEYRELKTLAAGIGNATGIDRAYESVLNFIFYISLFFCSVSAIEAFDALSLAVAIASIAVSFSFVIGSSCSTIFEGIVMILIRRPYDIGDRISATEVDSESNPSGTASWIVEDINLFYTTIRFGATREVATVPNGMISRCRIINANKSDKAQLLIHIKFGVNVPLSKVVLFKSAVQSFIHGRPQEFCKNVGFRLTRVETDLGFVEYVVVVQSRYSWAKVTPVLESKGKVASFCLEVQKKLDMRYISPSMPVNLTVEREDDRSLGTAGRQGGITSELTRRKTQATPAKTSPEPGHRAMPSMGDKISAIAELFGDTKKSK